MKIAFKLIAALSVAVLGGIPAMAGGDVSYDTKQNAAPFYFGGVVAYGSASYSVDGIAGSLDADGVMGGVVVGYRFMSGQANFAIEGDILGGNIEHETTASGRIDDRNISGTFNFGTTVLASLRTKASWGQGALQPYLTGGVAWQRLELDVSATATSSRGTETAAFETEGSQYGYTLGGGLDWQDGSSYSVTLGYQYYRFSEDDLTTNLHTIRLGGKLHY